MGSCEPAHSSLRCDPRSQTRDLGHPGNRREDYRSDGKPGRGDNRNLQGELSVSTDVISRDGLRPSYIDIAERIERKACLMGTLRHRRWVDFARVLWREIQDDNILDGAAVLAFFFLLAVFH